MEWVRGTPKDNHSGKWFLVRESLKHKVYCTRLLHERGNWFTDFPGGNVWLEPKNEDHASGHMRYYFGPIKVTE